MGAREGRYGCTRVGKILTAWDSHMGNPGISRDGKYSQNKQNWEILGNTNYLDEIIYTKICYCFFFFFFKFLSYIMLLYTLRIGIYKVHYIGYMV